MPTDPGAPVQSKSGSALGTEGTTPVVASLDSAIGGGNTILIFVSAFFAGNVPVRPVLADWPDGFDIDLEDNYGIADIALLVLRRVANDAEPTSWDLTPFGTSQRVNWVVVEQAGLSTDYHPFVSASTNATFTTSASNPFVAGTTGTLGWLGTKQFALFSSQQAVSWSGYTGGFAEVADVGAGAAPSFAVASAYSTATTGATVQAVNTHTTTNLCLGAVIVYRVADATFDGSLLFQDGFERGTANGVVNTTNPTASTRAASAIAGTVGTNVIVQSGSSAGAWSGYGLRVVQSGAAAYVRCDSTILGTQRTVVAGFHCRVVSSTGVVVLAEIRQTSATTVHQELIYDTANSKLGLRWMSSGVSQGAIYQNGTTAANTWVWVDWRVDNFGGAIRATEWMIDGVAQPAPGIAVTPIAVADTVGSFTLGSNTAQTVTVDFDDLIVSGIAGMYPFTKHHVRLLSVEASETPTISGTAANFNVFTANTTLGAWDGTNARNAVDEVPPTISASADGVTQITTAASDYAQFPMATWKLAGPEQLTGVRMWAAAWSGTGAGSGTFGVRGFDGTNEAILFPVGTAWLPGSVTTPSSTVPPWITAQWTPTGGWDQTKLDSAALRFGFSNDATPDMGVHNLMLEAAIRANEIDTAAQPVLAWRVDYTDGTSRESAAGPPVVTTGVRGVVHWHTAPYRSLDYGWSYYRVAGVLLQGATESEETYEAWRTALYNEPHPLA